MKNISINKITSNAIDQLQKIGKQTFSETYAEKNSEENMHEYLKNNFSTERLKAELADKNSDFYFAEFEDKVIGYLKVNFKKSLTEIKNVKTLEIQRIYVLNEFQGNKVGQILCEKVIEISKHKKVDYVWLGVWEENPRAIRFYEKNGFIAFDKHIFKLGDDEQTDLLMKREIN
ncbi:GNAT family N-acetyltransferase [Kordia sp. YSTF-M3]|uniref:GNAT family N-acetyltransferase n=1 Tax=Kordia aestuariivivens TaxID=2759037 RepID=A0ABR7Q791_9FLAO|nr:GNAT family N-acetyltransferase [Kordia aestuariivivens]MBC8754434.1 GNAT family N-acetyltransferase [Kordia aestuariivivens]